MKYTQKNIKKLGKYYQTQQEVIFALGLYLMGSVCIVTALFKVTRESGNIASISAMLVGAALLLSAEPAFLLTPYSKVL